MTENPYSTPIAESSTSHVVGSAPDSNSPQGIIRTTFLEWEMLRIVYVVLLGLLTLLLAGANITRWHTLITIIEGAVVANICFFAGPIVETYIRWLGYEGKWVRWLLFVGGTLLTALLATIAMASLLLPDQD